MCSYVPFHLPLNITDFFTTEICTAESCDPLTICIKQEAGEFKCTACPTGYNGTGISGCSGIVICSLVYLPAHSENVINHFRCE